MGPEMTSGVPRRFARVRDQDRRVALRSLLIFLAIGLGAPAAALAAVPSFSITPVSRAPYFIFNAHAGAVVVGRVRVTNVSRVGGSVRLYGVDATTGQTSGAVYLSRSAPQRQVGAWLSLATSQLVLAGHQHAVVSFSVRVPASASGGQHLGGIVAAPVLTRATQVTHHGGSSFHVKIQEISIVAVEVNLPGPRHQLMSINSLGASGRPGYQELLIGLGDDGNTLLKGHGQLSVSGAGGASVLNRSFALDTFVPHTKIAFPVYVVGRRLPQGSYRAVVRVVYGNGHVVTRTFGFLISSKQVRETFGSTVPPGAIGQSSGSGVPVWAVAVGGVLLLLIAIGGSALFFRARTARG